MKQITKYIASRPWVDVAVLTILLAVLFGFSLGDRPYSAPSESRYIEIGREMAQSGDFVTPRLNYVKYFEKPPLFYWMQALSTKAIGFDTFAARVPTAVLSVLFCLLAYGLGRMMYGRLAGFLGALVLATTVFMFALSRIVLVDVPVSLFMDATLIAFLYAVDAPDSRKRTWILYAMYAAAACAVLSKGLIGMLLPGAVVFLWLAFTKRWNVLLRMQLLGGTALFLLIAVPWHVVVSLRNPEFAHFYFIHEHFERYFTKEHGRYQPMWYFAGVLLGGLFPWLTFGCQAKYVSLKHAWKERFLDGRPLFLAIWILFIFVFFSISDSKLPAYILPIFLPIAVMMGRYFADAWKTPAHPLFGFRTGFAGMVALYAIMAAVPTIFPKWLPSDGKVVEAITKGGDDVQYLAFAALMAVIALVGVFIQGRPRHVIIALLLAAAVILEGGDQVAMHYSVNSMQLFSKTIQTLPLKPDDEVITYNAYFQDLPIYLQRRITIVNWRGELEFGSEHENDSAWMTSDAEFWKRWEKGDKRMIMIMKKESFDVLTNTLLIKDKNDKLSEQVQQMKLRHMYGMLQDDNNIIFMNQPIPDTLKILFPKKGLQ